MSVHFCVNVWLHSLFSYRMYDPCLLHKIKNYNVSHNSVSLPGQVSVFFTHFIILAINLSTKKLLEVYLLHIFGTYFNEPLDCVDSDY